MNSAPYHVLDADVIIIGAGLAGMTSAFTVLEKAPSLQVLILEAADRIGGRTVSEFLTVNNNELFEFDIAGQWIYSKQTPVFELIHHLALKVGKRTRFNDKIIINHEGKLYKINRNNPFAFTSIAAKLELATFIKKIETLCRLESLDPELASLSMETFINKNLSQSVNKAILESIILFNLGVTSASISVGFYVFFCITTHGIVNQIKMGNLREYWIQGGAQKICEKLAETLGNGIKLLKKTRALEITIYNHSTEVNSTNGTFYGIDVIMAVPPLAILEIKFTPPLPEQKVAALNNCTAGMLSKFVATYKNSFWKQNNCSGEIYVFAERPLQIPLLYCYDNSRDDKPSLAGFVKGNFVKKEVLESLAYHLGDEALEPLDFVMYKWAHGAPTSCYQYFENIEDASMNVNRIFWAGSETSLEWYGTICGAIISGNIAGRELLYHLRPAALTVEDMTVLRRQQVSFLQQFKESHTNIYTKMISPYYQALGIVLVAVICIIGHKTGLYSRVKSILIKR